MVSDPNKSVADELDDVERQICEAKASPYPTTGIVAFLEIRASDLRYDYNRLGW